MSIAALNIMAAVGVIAVMLLGWYLSRHVDHGEARFDSETGKPIKDDD